MIWVILNTWSGLAKELYGILEFPNSFLIYHQKFRTRIARIPRSIKRILLALLLLVLLYFLISFFLGNGNSSRTNGVNPLFDPHANPNIRIESKESWTVNLYTTYYIICMVKKLQVWGKNYINPVFFHMLTKGKKGDILWIVVA